LILVDEGRDEKEKLLLEKQNLRQQVDKVVELAKQMEVMIMLWDSNIF
jgi:hypothetical protein